MKASNAGAILLIGFGVLMLNLAYTGRASAVWDALRGSEPAASTTAPEDAADAEEGSTGRAVAAGADSIRSRTRKPGTVSVGVRLGLIDE